jgi:hypothetical protein
MHNRLPTRSARRLGATAVLSTLVVLIGACSSSVTPAPAPTSSPAPSISSGPSVAPTSTSITTPDAAAAVVIASDARFAGLGPEDPNLIGQCCFYTATRTADGFAVTIEIGWGDCPAGCIDRHSWSYNVAPDGTVRLVSEKGPPVPARVSGGGDGTTGGVIGISGIATAGPVCPVVRPNDSACADRSVAGATVHILDATGTEVATLETDSSGAFVVTLPPGRYQVVADPVPGLMGTAAPMDVMVGATLALVQLVYDTGIR